MEKIKCNPLYCLGINLTILAMLVSLAAPILLNVDQKITKIYEIIISERIKSYAFNGNKQTLPPLP